MPGILTLSVGSFTVIAERFSRQNLYPKLFSHSIGYTGSLNNEDLETILVDQSLQPKETVFNYSNIRIKINIVTYLLI